MSAGFTAAPPAALRRRKASRRLAAVLGGLLVLLALGALPAADGSPTGRGQHAVVLTNHSTDATALAVRSARLLPSHLPSAPLPLAVVALPLLLAPSALLAIWAPVWLLSRRSRQAHLLTSAGPGPPYLS